MELYQLNLIKVSESLTSTPRIRRCFQCRIWGAPVLWRVSLFMLAREFLLPQERQEFCAAFGGPEWALVLLLTSTEFLPLALEEIHHYAFQF